MDIMEGEPSTCPRRAKETVLATANSEVGAPEEPSDVLSPEIVCCAPIQTVQKPENIPATAEDKGEQKPEGASPKEREGEEDIGGGAPRKMNKRFYVTTPIYYVNDIPHIGHAYTTVAADIWRATTGSSATMFSFSRHRRARTEGPKGRAEKGRSPKEQADLMVENFKSLWKKFNISNDAFMRTTDTEHKKTVQGLLQMLLDRGEIEKRSYAGWYCTPDERFWTEKDLVGATVLTADGLLSKYMKRIIFS